MSVPLHLDISTTPVGAPPPRDEPRQAPAVAAGRRSQGTVLESRGGSLANWNRGLHAQAEGGRSQ
ncbi:hypothetical protein G3480_16335 [Thiorhodococcus mannitoliphagus]|uniref:Uncharacterized protein n=1 Tax=Thiorhodococcus mannitoliphagus TaxID=329406 RepID=A0A6P1DU56_9GAMM|nr:hypothetical protein [Thiorhodococcus mannitoliphagus]NEX21857.1 hypothetical protein [Thiorhodococcus mannitoliphagus]